jgi:protein SCO1/2
MLLTRNRKRRSFRWGGWAAMLMLSLLGALLATEDRSRFAIIRPAPDFTLTTHDDKPLRFTELTGKVRLVGFVFTTCNGTCPATTHRLALIQDELKRSGSLKDDRVQLLSITLDPARDTPAALRRYMQLYDIDGKHWRFLTGPNDVVQKVIADWGMWTKPAADGQLDHPSRVFLVDKQGRVREIYHLGFLKPAWVAEDIETLLKE